MQPARTLDRIKSFMQQQQRYRLTISLDNDETMVEAPIYTVVLLLGGVLFVLGTLIKLLIDNATD